MKIKLTKKNKDRASVYCGQFGVKVHEHEDGTWEGDRQLIVLLDKFDITHRKL